MKKTFLLFTLLLSALTIFSQVSLTFVSTNGVKGASVDMDVNAKNFTNISSFQFTLLFDSTVLEFDTVINTRAEIADLGYARGSLKGQVSFLWFNSQGIGINIADGLRLFSIRFKLIGKECDSSFVKIGSRRTTVEFINGAGNEVPSDTFAGIGKLKINGANCQTGSGGDEIIVSASNVDVPKGGNGCVKISMRNFKEVESMQGTFRWNKTVAQFSNIINSGTLKGLNPGQLALSPDSTMLAMIWDPGDGTAVTLPDNTVIFEICFNAVGNEGSSTDVEFISLPNRPIEFTGPNSKIYTHIFEKGKYTVIRNVLPLKLTIRDTSANENTELCIPVTVDGFTNISSFQFAVKYDTNLLQFKNVTNPSVSPFGPANVFRSRDSIRFQWDNPSTPMTINNGNPIFFICFDVVGKCTTMTNIQFVNLLNGPIEFTNSNNETPTVTLDHGIVTITCSSGMPVTIRKDRETGVSCNGLCDGKAEVTISGGSGSFNFAWLRQTDQSTASTVEDPTNLCPGEYRLRVTDRGTNTNSFSEIFIITEPDPIEIQGALITHETLGNDGAINLDDPTDIIGGIPPYTFKWTRGTNPTSISTNRSITGQRCADYILEVTDNNGCKLRDTFTIKCRPVKIDSIYIVDSLKCFGDTTGTIRVNVSQGRIPYTFVWSSQATGNPIRNLGAGTYTVTVSDADGTTASASITLTSPSRITIVVTNITPSSGADGAADATASGGSPPYTYRWTLNSNIVSNSQNLRNAVKGTYILEVTDRNGCISNAEVIIPENTGQGPTVILTIDKKAGNTDITCKGICDGKIISSTTGFGPFTYKWSHNGSLNSNIADNLCAGTYTVTVTDKNGKSTVAGPIIVSDVNAITLNIRRINCASSPTATDGQYEVNVSGGSSPYSLTWCNGETGTLITSLGVGPCSLSVTDVNGCTARENFTVCDITVAGVSCYKGRLAISPNGDGRNDVLFIDCINNVNNELFIYDRWGNQVYHAVNYLNDWDAVDLDGDDLNEGTYMWVVRVIEPGKNDTIYKGTVTVVR
ncbi:MAG: gliding motility-associated C-terminal domain-containing protein [Bacteroidota bacterium]|nr:gliding motility-associated C-terminal domain-containing protein [Bacteroidota bacterium]